MTWMTFRNFAAELLVDDIIPMMLYELIYYLLI